MDGLLSVAGIDRVPHQQLTSYLESLQLGLLAVSETLRDLYLLFHVAELLLESALIAHRSL